MWCRPHGAGGKAMIVWVILLSSSLADFVNASGLANAQRDTPTLQNGLEELEKAVSGPHNDATRPSLDDTTWDTSEDGHGVTTEFLMNFKEHSEAIEDHSIDKGQYGWEVNMAQRDQEPAPSANPAEGSMHINHLDVVAQNIGEPVGKEAAVAGSIVEPRKGEGNYPDGGTPPIVGTEESVEPTTHGTKEETDYPFESLNGSTYNDDFPTYDVDEKELPTIYQDLEDEDDFSKAEEVGVEDGVIMEEELRNLGITKGDLLSSLDSETLDALLTSRMKWLKQRMVQIYQEEVQRFDHTRDRIDGLLNGAPSISPSPSTLRSAPAPYDATPMIYGREMPPVGRRIDGRFWQPYIFDTGVGNRKEVEVVGVDIVQTLEGANIVKIIAVDLPEMPLLYVDIDGFAYIEVQGKLKRLWILNHWTLSPSGCLCGDASMSKNCACCVPGGCACRVAPDTCFACGGDYSSCHDTDRHGVKVSAGAGAVIYSKDQSMLKMNILAVAYGGSITFFSHMHGAGLKWVGSMSLQHEVTHLAFGTTFLDHDEATEESTFLVVFNRGAVKHQFNEIVVSSMAPTFTIGPPVKWHSKGLAMRLHQGDGWVLVTVHGDKYIYVYSIQEDKWINHHMVYKHTFGGVFHSWLVFSIELETYFAVAARRHIIFYHWNRMEDDFEQMNTIYVGDRLPAIEGLLAVNAESCPEEMAVVIAGHGREILTLVRKYNFTTSTTSFIMGFKGSLKVNVDWSTATHHSIASSKVVAVEAAIRQIIVFGVKASVQDIEHPMASKRDKMDNTIKYIKNENEHQRVVVAAAEARLAKSVLFANAILADVTITGSITISGILSTGRLSAVRLVFPSTELEHGVTHLQYLQHISSARPRQDVAKRLLQDMSTIEKSLAFAVPAAGPNRTIEGSKTIQSTSMFVLNSLTAASVSVAQLEDDMGGSFPLDTIMSSIIRVDKLHTLIRGSKTFASRVSVKRLHTSFLDDIPTNDLVTINGLHGIAGSIFRNGLWAHEVFLRKVGTIGGIDLHQAVLVGSSAELGRVVIATQDFVFGAVEVVSGFVSGVDLTRLYNHTLLTTGGHIAGYLSFATDLRVEDLDAVIMMGVDVTQLHEGIVYRDEDALIMGTLQVSQTITVEGAVTTGLVNGRKFPSDYAVKTASSPFVFGNVSFGHVTFGDVSFGPQGLIDGVDPRHFITRTTDQTINVQKVFAAGVDINEHLHISTKLLDGVNLDDLFSRDGRPSKLPVDWKFNVVYKADVLIQRLVTEGTVNGVDLSAVARDLVYKNEDKVTITGAKVFLKGLTISRARFQSGFNRVDLSSLVTIDSELIFSGIVSFTSDISFKSIVANRIAGIDLTALLSNALHLNKIGQVVIGRKVFLKPVLVGSLIIKGSLRGIDFRNYVTKTGNQSFIAPQIFRNANFAFLQANSIHMARGLKINGVDFSELAHRRLPLQEPKSHTAMLTIDGPLEVTGLASIETLNGVNLDQLLSTVVTDDGNYTIDGQVSLSTLRVLGSITTQGDAAASEFSIKEVANNAVRLSANNQVPGELSFTHVEVHGEFVVDGLTEGLQLGQLHQDAVYTDVLTVQTVGGAKMFEGLTVRGNVHARTINNIDLSTSLFTRTTDQVIGSRVTFTHVSALKNVFLRGHFNNFDLKALAQESLVRGKDEEIITETDITFSGQVTVRNLVLRGTLSTMDIAAVLADAVKLQDTAITITGKKTFAAGLSLANLHVEFLNRQRLDHFLESVVTRNQPHTLTGVVRVRGMIAAPWVTAQQLLIRGTVDNVDIKSLRQSVIFLAGHQSVDSSLVFTGSLSVRGDLQTVLLNHIALAEGYLTTSTSQTLNINFTVPSALASHVEVRGLVNSWNLPNEWSRTLLAEGGRNILGSVTLSGRLVVDGNIVVAGRVGRERMVKLSHQVVLLDRSTRVSGTLSFTAPLTVAWIKSITGVVNGINLAQLYNTAWYVDSTTQISTSVAFFGRVEIMQGLVSITTIDDLDVHRAYADAKAARDAFRNTTREFEIQFERICRPIERLYNKLEACMYEADYLVFHSGLPLASDPHESISFYALGTTVLLVSYDNACHLDFLAWEGHNFVMRQRIQHAGFGRHFYMLQGNEMVLVAMAASSHGNTCQNKNTTIWQVSTSGLQIYQVLGEGIYITEDTFAGGSLLLHSFQYTLAYTLDPHTHRWNHVATLPIHAGGVVVHPDYGVLHLLRDYTNSTTYVRHAVSAISRGGSKLLFALFSTITSCHGPYHALKVYREVDGIHHCVAEASLPTLPADLSVFFAGSKAAGAYMVVVAMHFDHFPIVFSFSGEVLSQWGDVEDAPTATWVEYALVKRPNSHFPEYHILLGPLPRLPTHHATTPTTPPTIPTPPVEYTSPTATRRPYTAPTKNTRDPYGSYGATSPYPTTTSNPYDLYATPARSYARSAFGKEFPGQYTAGAIFRLVMRGSAVAAANITCTKN